MIAVITGEQLRPIVIVIVIVIVVVVVLAVAVAIVIVIIQDAGGNSGTMKELNH